MSAPDQPAASGMKDELSAMLEDLIELARSSNGLDSGKLGELKQGLHDRVDQLGSDAQSVLKDLTSAIHAQADKAFEKVDDYAHEKPWHLVIAAGLVGLAVGVLVARK
jgi:ElaB protein